MGIFTSNLTSLIGASHAVLYPPRLDNAGNDFGLVPLNVATGTYGNGNVAFNNCVDFTSSAGGIDSGITTAGDNLWSEGGPYATACATAQHLYCFRSDGTAGNLTLPPVTGRRVFITKTAFDPSTGVAAADALCAAEASAALLMSDKGFVAFVATPTDSAASRLDLSPETLPFALVDGTQIVERPFDLMIAGGAVLATVDLVADGSFRVRKVVWTGAPDPTTTGTAASTCNGWTAKSAAAMGRQGFENDASGRWFSSLDAPCSFANASVLCFER